MNLSIISFTRAFHTLPCSVFRSSQPGCGSLLVILPVDRLRSSGTATMCGRSPPKTEPICYGTGRNKYRNQSFRYPHFRCSSIVDILPASLITVRENSFHSHHRHLESGLCWQCGTSCSLRCSAASSNHMCCLVRNVGCGSVDAAIRRSVCFARLGFLSVSVSLSLRLERKLLCPLSRDAFSTFAVQSPRTK